METPGDCFDKALRLSTWPKNATNTVTNDSSIVLAKRADNNDAVDGDSPPSVPIRLPYRGFTHATTRYKPETAVE